MEIIRFSHRTVTPVDSVWVLFTIERFGYVAARDLMPSDSRSVRRRSLRGGQIHCSIRTALVGLPVDEASPEREIAQCDERYFHVCTDFRLLYSIPSCQDRDMATGQ